MDKTLVAYFSATGTTAGVAKKLAEAAGAALYEIKPQELYTAADLNWQDKNSRSSVEMADKSSRPELADKNAPISDYDTLFLGFPIWWHVAPTIINTFWKAMILTVKKSYCLLPAAAAISATPSKNWNPVPKAQQLPQAKY